MIGGGQYDPAFSKFLHGIIYFAHCIIFGGCFPSNKNLALVTRPEFECMSLNRNEWDSTAPREYDSTSPKKVVFLGAETETKGHCAVSDV